ncbi:FadR family transcriptional regulator [Candidatus Bipolaricaulota bacterium]|nr:FadR family transcriptional regulator [Candidatus Bipolaricaulota bacterium]
MLSFVVGAIASGECGVGDRLPTERELAGLCGVSRSSVREALSILSALNIVDRRVGDGTYVRTSDETILTLALELAQSEGDLKETFELQRILEVGVAELAARKMSPEKLSPVEQAFEEMERACAEGDIEAYFAGDRKFHLAVARATGNALLEQSVLGLLQRMDQPLWRLVKRYHIKHSGEYLKRSLLGHRRLLQALRVRDTALARRVMEDHFERIEQEIFDAEGP